jgi:hypothetical protein
MRVACHVRPAPSHEEIEIGAFVRLLDVFDIKPEPSTLWERWRRPVRTASGESIVIDIQPN